MIRNTIAVRLLPVPSVRKSAWTRKPSSVPVKPSELGMGYMDGTCGAVSGAVMLAGFKNSDGCLANPGPKQTPIKLSREILETL